MKVAAALLLLTLLACSHAMDHPHHRDGAMDDDADEYRLVSRSLATPPLLSPQDMVADNTALLARTVLGSASINAEAPPRCRLQVLWIQS